MKFIIPTFVIALLLAICSTAQSSITLSTFGNTVEGSGWSYNPANSTISGTDAFGALLYPSNFSPVNLSTLGAPNTLFLSLTGLVTTAPVGGFTISLEDSLGNLSVTPFSWSSFTTTPSTVNVAVDVPVAFDWSNVAGWTLDSGATGDAVNATFTELTVVPEPSTYALLSMAGIALGGYLWRRRK